MVRQKKFLLCMYVDDFCGMKEESFNFYIKRRYIIQKGKISRKNDEEIEEFPDDFWGKNNISAVTLLIGENGAGKTTLMRLLIKWLCQLSAGHLPKEKGALVIHADNKDKLIAFDDGKFWGIEIDEKEEEKERIFCVVSRNEIKEILSDVRLAYYTDTMTDLELSDMLTTEELKFLRDDSLFTRLSHLMESGYTAASFRDSIKREDFKRQMDCFLHIQDKQDKKREFPIRYMKLEAIKAGDEKGFERVPSGNEGLIGEAVYLWNRVFSDQDHQNLSDIAKNLLWGLFSGTITSLLQWEKTLPNMGESILTGRVRDLLRAYIREQPYVWDDVFTRFFKNMFRDCESAFRDPHCYEQFCTKWDWGVVNNLNSFLKVLKDFEQKKDFGKKYFWCMWLPSENAHNIWEFKLEYFKEEKNEEENLLQDWKCLWESYKAVAHLMPECRFDWKYASSGGKNQGNLYSNLFNNIQECSSDGRNQLWFLLDEPDNTFHPDWKRKIIQNLLEECLKFDTLNFQLLISTHSPIMLSDVPKQAAILLKAVEDKEKGNKTEKKKQVSLQSSSFGQQIYTLFNDAFFMEEGIIGAFSDKKIGEVSKELYKLEGQLFIGEKDGKVNALDMENKLEKCKHIITLIEEPLLHGSLSQSYKLCNQKLKNSVK